MKRSGTLISDSDVIESLRALHPGRPLEWAEAHSIAERQAALLLDLLHVAEPPVPQFVISSLPGVFVDRLSGWPTSGMAVEHDGGWRIVINRDEPRQRQRFSLAHEFKHILDDPFQSQTRNAEDDQRVERLCNFFAACLLMPRPWVKHDWGFGQQTPARLARRYYVSTEAMKTRLSELGLTVPTLAMEYQHRHAEAA